MKNKSMKEIKDEVASFGSVTNANRLAEGVPLLCDGIARARAVSKSLIELTKLLEKLSEKCSKYVMEHPACLDGGMNVSPIGVKSGDLTVDGKVYHFYSGFGTPIREDGGKLTQEFLTSLPEGWFKVMAKLDTTGIERITGTAKMAEQLSHYGLIRPVKNVWQESEPEICDDFSD